MQWRVVLEAERSPGGGLSWSKKNGVISATYPGAADTRYQHTRSH
jgi:hypothetical protein